MGDSSGARNPRPLRVLHLGFEDPTRPGAGGGSRRTHEVNRRLSAAGVDVTVLCAAYPGAKVTCVDGVVYRPVGRALFGRGSHPFLAQLGYFALIITSLWWYVRRHRPDIIVEDFSAPFSSVSVPRLTRLPVVGVVQWLFAQEKTEQYGLPFNRIESWGLASHNRLIAVSEGLAAQLRVRNTRASVTTVPNGIEPHGPPYGTTIGAPNRTAIVYLGRVEIHQKGLDLLVAAFASVAGQLEADLWIAGDGPDTEAVRALATTSGVGDRVHLIGPVEGSSRFDLLAQARLVVMPSRYETFGMVAAESLSVGTPVLAFDIPCLRDLLPPTVGRMVPAFDIDEYAAALVELVGDPLLCRSLGAEGPGSVAHLDWDRIAQAQLAVYQEAAATPTRAASFTGAARLSRAPGRNRGGRGR